MIVSMIWQGFLTLCIFKGNETVCVLVQSVEISQVRPHNVRGTVRSQLPRRKPQFRMYLEQCSPCTQMLGNVLFVFHKSCAIPSSTPKNSRYESYGWTLTSTCGKDACFNTCNAFLWRSVYTFGGILMAACCLWPSQCADVGFDVDAGHTELNLLTSDEIAIQRRLL